MNTPFYSMNSVSVSRCVNNFICQLRINDKKSYLCSQIDINL